jgi:starch-binding outer membrane protein, SusD/RagB family
LYLSFINGQKDKNMKRILHISYLLLAVFSLWSCSKNFLEEPPRTVTILDLINDPQNGAERILGAVYNRLYDWETHSFAWLGVSSITSDEADKGSSPGDGGADKIELDAWTFAPSSLSFNDVWEGNFEGVGRACNAIAFFEQMDLPQVDQQRFIGEAKFLRAYYNWNLVRCYGVIPKIDKVLASQADIEAASIRASESEIYAFIEQDLRDAISGLPNSVTAAERGRPTNYAAQAFLAKVLLYQERWAEAEGLADAVIGSNQYELFSDYGLIWREAGEFGKESLWEINAVTLNPSKGITGYTEVQGMRGSGDNDFGWGFNTPSERLYNSYEPGDKRRDATFLTSGSMLWDGYQTASDLPNRWYNYKAYCSKIAETNFDRNQSNKNLRVFRYGEVLLIKAEAANELGDTTSALGAINQLRARAGLGGIFAEGVNQLREKIYTERWHEMAMEHDRIFDLRRTGRAEQVLQAAGKAYMPGKHEYFPIPQRQIDLSGGKLLQNPGY